MKKIVENKFYDTGNFEITVENNYIRIENIDDASMIKKIEIYGKVNDIEKAMKVAEKYIEKVENRRFEYAEISKVFATGTILDFKLVIKNTFRISYKGSKKDCWLLFSNRRKYWLFDFGLWNGTFYIYWWQQYQSIKRRD